MKDVLNYIQINSFTLKIIAIITMAIDHVGAVFFPQYIVLRIIGRLSFPIFCFLVVEGFCHTRDVKKYMGRMAVFAVISEIPFDLAFQGQFFTFQHQNVFFTLFLGLLTLYLLNNTTSKILKVGGVILIMLIAEVLRTDYSSTGIIMILLFYIFRKNSLYKILSVAGLNIFLMGNIQIFGTLALIPVALYNGKRGLKVKYVFYAFYPVHLFLIFIIRTYY